MEEEWEGMSMEKWRKGGNEEGGEMERGKVKGGGVKGGR